jgi:hypothetical protein
MSAPRLALIALLVGGCNLPLPDGRIQCALTEPTCPHGMSCAFDSTCWTNGHTPPHDLANGAACTYAQSCASGQCADGVCCSAPCTGACTTCASTDQPGTCVSVTDGTLAGAGHDACEVGALCNAGQCKKKDQAEACATDIECNSNACVDQVCCKQACGRCETCNAEGSIGSCTPAAAGTDPHLDCHSASADDLCQARCDGAGDCLIPTGTCKVDCERSYAIDSPVGQIDSATLRTFICSAAGRCEFVLSQSVCSSFDCAADEQSCLTKCATDFDCYKGFYCNNIAGVCQTVVNPGNPCMRDLMCDSGYCDPGTMKCMECKSNADCDFTSYCGTNNACTLASDCTGLTCAASGLGSSCQMGTAGGYACAATADGQCTNPGSPIFDGGQCMCASDSKPGCRIDDVCSQMTDPSTARCVAVAGRPCYDDHSCASGTCTAHVCAKAGPGVMCRSAADCTSGTCAPTAASDGRPVCN